MQAFEGQLVADWEGEPQKAERELIKGQTFMHPHTQVGYHVESVTGDLAVMVRRELVGVGWLREDWPFDEEAETLWLMMEESEPQKADPCECHDPRTVWNETQKNWVCEDCKKPVARPEIKLGYLPDAWTDFVTTADGVYVSSDEAESRLNELAECLRNVLPVFDNEGTRVYAEVYAKEIKKAEATLGSLPNATHDGRGTRTVDGIVGKSGGET